MSKVLVYKMDKRAVLPEQKSIEAAGFDLCCLENFSISPGQSLAVRTGLVVQPPEGYHTEIFLRSSLAKNYGIMLGNNIGLVDRDYAGKSDEVIVLLHRVPYYTSQNRGVSVSINQDRPVEFKAGDRIAQLVFRKTEVFELVEVKEAPAGVDRGGFGSTGVK